MEEPQIVPNDSVVRLTDGSTAPEAGYILMGDDVSKLMELIAADPKKLGFWKTQGASCLKLEPGGEWVKGRVQFSLVFTPDQTSNAS